MQRLKLGYRTTGALIVGIAVAIVLIAYSGFNPLDDSTTVRAEFRDASGIGVVGQDVRIAGVPVGRITDVDRSGDDAIVTMKLDSDVGTIRDDATAELRPNLPFEGTAHVDLSPGSPNAAPLDPDRRIDSASTSSYVSSRAYGTSDSCVWSASQGQPPGERRRSMTRTRSRSASAA